MVGSLLSSSEEKCPLERESSPESIKTDVRAEEKKRKDVVGVQFFLATKNR